MLLTALRIRAGNNFLKAELGYAQLLASIIFYSSKKEILTFTYKL